MDPMMGLKDCGDFRGIGSSLLRKMAQETPSKKHTNSWLVKSAMHRSDLDVPGLVC